MSDFSEIMLAVLNMILGFWGAIIFKVWENTSKGKKTVMITVTVVVALLDVIALANHNGWISLPKIELSFPQQTEIPEPVRPSDTGDTDEADKPVKDIDARDTLNFAGDILKWLGRIALELVAFFFTLFIVLIFRVLIGFLLSFFPLLIFKNITEDTIYCISGSILSTVLPFVRYFILHMDMSFAGMSSVADALLFGLGTATIAEILLKANMPATSKNMFGRIFILSACLYILIAYEMFLFLTTRQFALPLGVFKKWIMDSIINMWNNYSPIYLI